MLILLSERPTSMQNSQLLTKLVEAGLGEKEARLYLAGMELGASSIQQLARQAGVKRPTAYEIIEGLKLKGLFSVVSQGKRQQFLAEDPEGVLAIMKTREQAILRALPELRLLYTTGGKKPRIRFFEGVEGLKAMYWDTLESKGIILVYGSIDDMWEAMPREFIRAYVKERTKKDIHIRGLVPNTSEAQEYVRRDKEEMRNLVLIPKDQFIFSNEINIYNDKVAIFSFPEKIGVIIESKKIAETQRSIFELAWLGAMRA